MSGASGVASAAPLSGLASYHQTATTSEVDLEPREAGCPHRVGMVYLNLQSGETRPARCGRNACDYCLRVNAKRRALAIAWARPEREIRLSLLAEPDDAHPWQTARRRYRRMREYLRRWSVDPGEWGLMLERNPQGTGYHGHVIQHGPKVNKDALDQAAFRAGAGLTRVRKVRDVGSLSSYGLKGAALAAYGLKGTQDHGETFLDLNGGRLGHFTPGFFRSPSGATMGVRAAERQALRAVYGTSEGEWTLATESGARSWASLPQRRPLASVTPITA